MRICYACGSDRTYIYNKSRCEQWYINNDSDNNVLCKRCGDKYIWSPKHNKKWNPINHQKRMWSHGHSFYVSWLKRKGICSICDGRKGVNIKYTLFHHSDFIRILPWFGTIEICQKCHVQETKRLGQYKRNH